MLVIKESDPNAVELACEFLKQGKIISFASDTVYGIAADASNKNALEKLYKAKNRSHQKPIAIFLKDLESAKKIFYFDEVSQKISDKFLPGFLTMVLRVKQEAFKVVAPNLNKNNNEFLGFRIINREFVSKLLEKFGGIIAVSSANQSDFEAAKNCDEVVNYFSKEELLDLVIDGGESGSLASTVIKIDNNKIEILREGAVKKELIFDL
jgi:L-threonylcarbamoyladenylate synthase